MFIQHIIYIIDGCLRPNASALKKVKLMFWHEWYGGGVLIVKCNCKSNRYL